VVVPVDQADTLDREMPSRLPSLLFHLVRSQRGATSIEYALVVTLISMVLVAAANNLGSSLQTALNDAASVLN
jgi:Flp pilus assembly pilin Flp